MVTSHCEETEQASTEQSKKNKMGNNLRCCLACVLPCGALDVIRIVHLSGRVDEYGRAVSAGEILAAHPNHVLSSPCSSRQGAVGRRILIVSPESELERGEIYFLIPAASVPDGNKRAGAVAGHRHVRSKSEGSAVADRLGYGSASSPEKTTQQQQQQQHRRRMSTGSHASPWQPHLACIAEDP